MIRVRMRRQDRRHTPGGRSENPLDVYGIVRPRIDHREALRAEQIRIGAGTGHEPRVARDQPAHAGRDFVQLAGCQRHGILAESSEHILVRLESSYHAPCRRSRRRAFVIAVTTAILIVLVGGAAGVALLAYRRRQQPASDEESSLAATPAEPITAPEPTIDDAPYSTDAIQAA